MGEFLLLAFVFLVAGDALPNSYREPLSVSMGVLLLVFAMRHSFASAIAEQELLKQYDFMFRVFKNASRRIAAAVSDDDKRQVLRALGTAAIDEQAQWLMRQRERTIDNAEIWRMGS